MKWDPKQLLTKAMYGKKGERVMRHKVQHDIAEAEALFYKADKCEEQGLQNEAFEYMRKAAELGHSSAQANLGNYYSWGKGVKKSNEKAAYWYKRAYLQGNDTGAFNLAIDKLRAQNLRAAVFGLKELAHWVLVRRLWSFLRSI
jgi:TPR repeat protein